MRLNKSKRIIGWLSLLAVVLSVPIRKETIAILAVTVCALICVCTLYPHLPQLSNISGDNPKAKTLRIITVGNVLLVLLIVLFAVLNETGAVHLSDAQSSWLIAGLFAVIMMGFGNVAPQIPFNRYTGLRLPWTVSDEETWIVAHRILGYVSFPCGLLCFAGVGNLPTTVHLSLLLFLLWISIPAVLSYLFYRKKWNPKDDA